jgi:hypothetical protein
VTALLTPFTLTGRFIRLEPLAMDHAEALAKAAASDRATFGLTTVPDGMTEAERYVAVSLDRQATGRELPFAVRRLSDDQIVGSTRFLDLDVFAWPAPSPAAAGAGAPPNDLNPPSVAEVGPTAVACPVTTAGALWVVKAWSAPVAEPASLVAISRKW